MYRNYLIYGFFIFLFLFNPVSSFAQSSYVLPYPSAMPGSFEYKLDLIKENIYQYLYFGNLAQFKFKLDMADKYLVEAKTLLEYKQYLLGYEALLKSDNYFRRTVPALLAAKRHNVDVSEKEKLLQEASDKHIEVLEKLKAETPETFLWTPEKGNPTSLNFVESFENSINIRKILQ